jgi:hypothetical protein
LEAGAVAEYNFANTSTFAVAGFESGGTVIATLSPGLGVFNVEATAGDFGSPRLFCDAMVMSRSSRAADPSAVHHATKSNTVTVQGAMSLRYDSSVIDLKCGGAFSSRTQASLPTITAVRVTTATGTITAGYGVKANRLAHLRPAFKHGQRRRALP